MKHERFYDFALSILAVILAIAFLALVSPASAQEVEPTAETITTLAPEWALVRDLAYVVIGAIGTAFVAFLLYRSTPPDYFGKLAEIEDTLEDDLAYYAEQAKLTPGIMDDIATQLAVLGAPLLFSLARQLGAEVKIVPNGETPEGDA